MARKMPGRLVALSASAVATIYVAGLLSTQSAAQSVANAAAPFAVTTSGSTAATDTSAPGVVVGASSSSSTSTSTSTSTSQSTTSSTGYTNGTYSATGNSALGSVTVSLTVAGGKISNVQITRVTTKFPMSRIASLPAQVVSKQSANVNGVSGATYSSQAFKQAVQLALTQAQAAPATAATAG
ncbi:MAG TPA: FMN-binding protein [Chloroflexota bacterium]